MTSPAPIDLSRPDAPTQGRRRRSSVVRLVASALLLALLQLACRDGIGTPSSAAAVDAAPPRKSLVAMARLEPASRVISVAAAESDIVKEILVADGEAVSQGDPLVVLARHDLRLAEVEAARLEVERVELKPFDIEAQRARIRSVAAELEHARNEVGSQERLSAKGFTAGGEYQNAILHVRRTEEQLNEANSVLKGLEAGLDLQRRKARNDLALAEERLSQTIVRAPIDGRVLRILVEPGERLTGSSLLKLGQTNEMHAVAEIHANDIHLIELGQRATFTSAALRGPIEGSVQKIGSMIFKNDLFGEGAPRGLRVILVRIRLNDDPLAANLTNLEGQIRIALVGPPAD